MKAGIDCILCMALWRGIINTCFATTVKGGARQMPSSNAHSLLVLVPDGHPQSGYQPTYLPTNWHNCFERTSNGKYFVKYPCACPGSIAAAVQCWNSQKNNFKTSSATRLASLCPKRRSTIFDMKWNQIWAEQGVKNFWTCKTKFSLPSEAIS